MGDLNNILVAICGFGTVCCGAFLLATFALLRVTGRSLLIPAFSALMSVIDRGTVDDDEVDLTPRQSSVPRTSSTRDRIQRTLDSADQGFQDALRQQGVRPNQPPSTQERDFSTNGLGDPNEIPSLRRRRRDQNDIIGYDEDDDGLLDF